MMNNYRWTNNYVLTVKRHERKVDERLRCKQDASVYVFHSSGGRERKRKRGRRSMNIGWRAKAEEG